MIYSKDALVSVIINKIIIISYIYDSKMHTYVFYNLSKAAVQLLQSREMLYLDHRLLYTFGDVSTQLPSGSPKSVS